MAKSLICFGRARRGLEKELLSKSVEWKISMMKLFEMKLILEEMLLGSEWNAGMEMGFFDIEESDAIRVSIQEKVGLKSRKCS